MSKPIRPIRGANLQPNITLFLQNEISVHWIAVFKVKYPHTFKIFKMLLLRYGRVIPDTFLRNQGNFWLNAIQLAFIDNLRKSDFPFVDFYADFLKKYGNPFEL
jgi:hypothetical protein